MIRAEPKVYRSGRKWNTAQVVALFTKQLGSEEYSVANNKDPNQKRPGEKEPGKYHYNPGNMSGKSMDSCKPESEQRANADRIRSRDKQDQSRDD
jgi:hypothetical protein